MSFQSKDKIITSEVIASRKVSIFKLFPSDSIRCIQCAILDLRKAFDARPILYCIVSIGLMKAAGRSGRWYPPPPPPWSSEGGTTICLNNCQNSLKHA